MYKSKNNKANDEPKKKTIYTISLTNEQMDKLYAWLDRHLWIDYEVAYARFAFKGNNVNVVAYESGKVVVQGKNTEDFVRDVLEGQITLDPQLGYEEVHHPEWYEAHAGMDESGKGDLFGPIVTCCVIADGDMVRYWGDKGIRDSKKITSDNAIMNAERIIRGTKGVVIETSYASMEKYNELYYKFGSNLNKLLAWQHAKALEAALKKRQVPWGMLDQFSKQKLVQNYYENDDFDLRQMTKAEADPVVAAASICARATYVRQLNTLGKTYDRAFVKGSGKNAKEQAKKLVEEFGADVLPKLAKMHFRTAKEVLGLPVEEKKPWHY